MELDDGRERKVLNLGPVAERIAFTLDKEAWTLEAGEMRCSKVLRLSRWVERIAETNQPADGACFESVIGEHAGHTPAK